VGLWAAVAFHRLLDEFQRRGLVSFLCDRGFQHLALVVDGAPEVAHLAIDLHLDRVETSSPVGTRPHALDPLSPGLRGEHRAKLAPPEPHRLVADVDPALEEQISTFLIDNGI
jgi:hypothetical protein